MNLAVLLLAVCAAAQSPMPTSGEEPPKTEAVAASTQPAAAAPAEAPVSHGVKVADGAKVRIKPALHAVIHPEAKDWEPVSLHAGGDPGQATSSAVLRQVRFKGKLRGETSRAKASARLIPSKEDRWLVVSIFPKALERKRGHFEIRFRLVEGFVEDVQVRAVTVVARDLHAGIGLDSYALRAGGIAFEEDSPGSAQILVSALDARPGKKAFNAGKLKLAAFAGKDLGYCDASWSVRGLTAPK